VGFQVILTTLAKEDLRGIAEYIALDDPISAERFSHALLDDALALKLAPYRGKVLKRKPTVRFVVKGPYLVYYRVEEGNGIIRILRFWNGLRQPDTPTFKD
jgi:plasmid stabilization system protein ParE